MTQRPTAAGAAAIPRPARFLARAELGRLLDVLHDEQRTVIGPLVRDGAIVYDEIRGPDELPAGWGAEQTPGRYRLRRREDERLFDFAVGLTAWKRYTFPPHVSVSVSERIDGQVSFAKADPEIPRLALLGVRACEIAALLVQDRVFAAGPAGDADYLARRADAIVILEAVIRTDGTVGDICVVRADKRSLGFPRSAVDAVRRWRYKPATRDGQIMEVTIPITITFDIH